MATMVRVLNNAVVTLDGTDFSEQTTSVQLTTDVKDEDVTTFAAEGWTEVEGTRKSGKLDAEMLIDDGVDDFMWANFGTKVPFTVKPDDGAISTSNPEYSGTVLVPGFAPVDGKPSDVARVKLSFKTSGPIVRDVTP